MWPQWHITVDCWHVRDLNLVSSVELGRSRYIGIVSNIVFFLDNFGKVIVIVYIILYGINIILLY